MQTFQLLKPFLNLFNSTHIALPKCTFFASRCLTTSAPMANSRFDYVRSFERDDTLLPNAWIVVRVDGKGFHKFSAAHDFAKPNDRRGTYTLLV